MQHAQHTMQHTQRAYLCSPRFNLRRPRVTDVSLADDFFNVTLKAKAAKGNSRRDHAQRQSFCTVTEASPGAERGWRRDLRARAACGRLPQVKLRCR